MARGQVVLDKDKGWRQIRRSFFGQFGSTEVDAEIFVPGDPTEQGTIAHYAAINEYGSEDGRIPERSFLRSTVTSRHADYTAALVKATTKAVAAVARDPSVDAIKMIEASLQRLGVIAVADVQRAIAQGIEPANAPSTIEAKGSSKPLIDTGALRQAITSRTSQRQRGKLRAGKAR